MSDELLTWFNLDVCKTLGFKMHFYFQCGRISIMGKFQTFVAQTITLYAMLSIDKRSTI